MIPSKRLLKIHHNGYISFQTNLSLIDNQLQIKEYHIDSAKNKNIFDETREYRKSVEKLIKSNKQLTKTRNKKI